ncbi:MAG: hypothetical protein JJU11_02355 [Candidatus Sumerlaeia bacterium]|nr:hypothetical protein [Candidatus Sumerlaeia bacterium]
MSRVCLVTPGRLSCNPRVVKEADALHGAGIPFQVVSGILGPLPVESEDELLASKPWRDRVIRIAPRGLGWTVERAKNRIAQKAEALSGIQLPSSMAPIRHSALIPAMTRAAIECKADLYIGHYLAGLVAAGKASESHRASLGFDAEDAHHMELEGNTREEKMELAARKAIESKWLPHCTQLTAAAPLIAESYRKCYGVSMETILNVFPLNEGTPEVVPDANKSPVLYWFSQKIGPGRGLEELLTVLNKLKTDVKLALRGICTSEYRDALLSRAGAVDIQFLPPVKSEELIKSSSVYTLGLCLEQTIPPHRDVCLTNKIFSYLLAGVPMLLSKTAAHVQVAPEFGDAAILLDMADKDSTVKAIDRFLGDVSRRETARSESHRLGQTRYNWEREQDIFLHCVEAALRQGGSTK